MKSSLTLLLMFLSIFLARAQQNPPDILWKNIKSEHFKVIFPQEIENEAQRIAKTLEWAYQYNTKSLKIKPKPISIVLYNRSNTSNAYAALGPRRMGWYLTPSQTVTNLGSVDWVQTLAIHEYRHIVQYAKNRQHFTKFVTYFFGDMGQYMMRWSIPDWFYEGDAIAMETALTKGGRGRIPAFELNIRTYALTDENFTYDQAYLGSYKRFYPDHYHLGYPLIAYGRVNYGSDIWDKVLDRTNRISWWPYAFGSSLKKYTGLNVNKFYKAAMFEYDSIWKSQDKEIEATDFKILNNKKKKNLTNYFNPKYNINGNIICGKESMDKISAFYEIGTDGKEKRIKNTDAGLFNLNDEKLTWSRTIPDLRWGEAAFADVVVYDLKSKKELRLTNKEQLLSPALSPDGKIIAAIEHNNNQETKLLLLEAESGDLITSYANIGGENDYLRTPVWSKRGDYIAFTHSKYKGSALSFLNVHTGEIKKVIDYNWSNIGRPVFYKDYILYNSDYSGIGNIYAVELITGRQFQVTSSKFGAYNADVSPDEKKIVFQEYHKMGFDIAEMQLNPFDWKPIEKVTNTDPKYYELLVAQEGGITIDSLKLSEENYPVVSYNKFKDGLKIHSWGIFPSTPYLDASIMSNNYLNTLSVTGGYLYNTNEKTHAGYLGITYSKFFPVISVVSTISQMKETYNDSVSSNWNEFRLSAGLSIPLNLSRNVFRTGMTFGAGINYTYVNGRADIRYLDQITDGSFTPIYLSYTFSNAQRYSWRDFNPRFAQYLNLDYRKIMPYDADYEGYLFSARSNFYFPGLLRNNSIKLGAAFEKQLDYDSNNRKRYYFSSKTSFARGFSSVFFDKMYKLSADYQLPLWSPDISIGPLVYIKRIRLGGFYDYLQGWRAETSGTYKSVGGSLRFEFNVFRINYPLELGVQYAYRINDGDYQISFLILGLPI